MIYLRLPERPGFVVTAIAVISSFRTLAISNAPSTTLQKIDLKIFTNYIFFGGKEMIIPRSRRSL
jgi:hypothetical protein